MKLADVLKSSIQNTFRSKLRTGLTVIAIFIGAFTLTITSAIGAGVSDYIDSQLGSIAADGVMIVTKAPEATLPGETGPKRYDPERAATGANFGPGSQDVLNASDLEKIRATSGITEVNPYIMVNVDFVTTAGSNKYEMTINPGSMATTPSLAAGKELSNSDTNELLLPDEFLDAFNFAQAADAIGKTVTFGVTDAVGKQHEVDATIIGVQNASLLSFGAGINQNLTDAINAAQTTGRVIVAPATYVGAMAYFDPASTPQQIKALKAELADQKFNAQTPADQIGMFQTVIDGIIGVLNAFAVIALIAAGFGIVNTLLMSVQERTREIGLMKAMGMSSAKVFGLFSGEAVFIGFLGSAIGAAIATLVGTAISSALANSVLSGLPGLNIMLFQPGSIVTVILVVMLIAFAAGTLPARRAAKQNPIDALRYE